MTEVWFRYRDDDDQKSYYYNASTHETTWNFPVGRGSVWDAESRRKLKLPHQTKLRPPPAPKPPPSEDSDEDEYSEQQEKVEENSEENSEESGPSGALVVDYSQEIVDKWSKEPFDFSKFEAEKMNKLKKDKFAFSDKPIDNPLLNTVKRGDAKIAVRNYKIILKQAGLSVKGLKGGETLLEVIESLKESDDLVDEAYADLWKLTTNCKKDNLILLLDLFLILATSFVPSDFLYTPLLKHLSNLAGSDKYARFVLIRLHDTIARELPLQKCSSDDDIKTILDNYKKANCLFGVSHYEVYFNQYVKRPTAPIPIIEYQLLENVKEQGGRDRQNIFRAAGNKKQVDTLIRNANLGKDVITDQTIDDVAALLKRWFELLPGRLIPITYIKEFNEATKDISDTDPIINFVNTLPNSIQAVLKYLVGYLRDFAENSSVNQMTLEDFATVFGPIIVFDDSETNDVMKFTQAVKFFMKTVLEKWDIGNAYPINPASMKAKKIK